MKYIAHSILKCLCKKRELNKYLSNKTPYIRLMLI